MVGNVNICRCQKGRRYNFYGGRWNSMGVVGLSAITYEGRRLLNPCL